MDATPDNAHTVVDALLHSSPPQPSQTYILCRKAVEVWWPVSFWLLEGSGEKGDARARKDFGTCWAAQLAGPAKPARPAHPELRAQVLRPVQ